MDEATKKIDKAAKEGLVKSIGFMPEEVLSDIETMLKDTLRNQGISTSLSSLKAFSEGYLFGSAARKASENLEALAFAILTKIIFEMEETQKNIVDKALE